MGENYKLCTVGIILVLYLAVTTWSPRTGSPSIAYGSQYQVAVIYPRISPSTPTLNRSSNAANVPYLNGLYVRTRANYGYSFWPDGKCYLSCGIASSKGYYEVVNGWEIRMHIFRGLKSHYNEDVPTDERLFALGDGSVLIDKQGSHIFRLRDLGTPALPQPDDHTRSQPRTEISNPSGASGSYDPTREKVGIEEKTLNPDSARKLGLPRGAGIYVNSVAFGSRAYVSGIRRGDIVTQIDGKIAGANMFYHWDFVEARYVDSQTRQIRATVFRSGVYYSLAIRL